MNDDTQTEVFSFRIDGFLSRRLDALKRKTHINLSSYARTALVEALNRDYPIADAATLDPDDIEAVARHLSHA